MTLSIFSIPINFSYAPCSIKDLLILLFINGNNVLFINVDFPLPETPVINTKFPKGIFRLIFFKLFSLAPKSSINNPLPFLIFFGTGIKFLLFIYFEIKV